MLIFAEVRPASQKPERSERTKACLLRTRQFPISAVADEPGFRDVHSQALRRLQINPGIGLRDAYVERERRAVEFRGTRTHPPCRYVLGETVADDGKSQVATAEVVEHHHDLRLDRGERLALRADSLVAHPVQGGIINMASEATSNVPERV